MRTDVIVVGAGPAGLSAAVALAEGGRDVRLIARGNGFTHWAPGAVDVLARAGGEAVEQPLAGIDRLPERHPYRIIGADAVRRGIDRFTRFAEAAGLRYEGTLDANRWQVTALGTVRPTALLPEPSARPLTGKIVALGFDGFRDFAPALCAKGLSDRGYQASPASVELPPWDHERHFFAMDLARALDDADWRAKLADRMGPAVRGADTVVVPAVLGLATGHQAWADLEDRLGTRLVEAALVPPSVPGMRLYAAWVAKLRDLGVRLQIGFPAIEIATEGGKIKGVVTEGAARPILNRCNEVVLATGGVPGRGIEANRDGSLTEVVAGLPVRGFEHRSGFLAQRFFDDQPLAGAGVEVDDELHPLDTGGDPALAGLRCAGGLLAGHDPVAEGSREGVALSTAARAAELLTGAPATV